MEETVNLEKKTFNKLFAVEVRAEGSLFHLKENCMEKRNRDRLSRGDEGKQESQSQFAVQCLLPRFGGVLLLRETTKHTPELAKKHHATACGAQRKADYHDIYMYT